MPDITKYYFRQKIWTELLLMHWSVVYPEKTIAEDAYVIVPLMEHCRKVAFSTAQKYYYVHRRESLTTSGFRWSDLGSVEVWDHNQNVVEERHRTAAGCDGLKLMIR